MKIFLLLTAAVVVLCFLGSPIERAVNDTAPIAREEQTMIAVDLPAPVLPLADPVEPTTALPTPSTPPPLSATLVTIADSQVMVRQGTVKLNAGVPVTLVRDRGDKVDIRWREQNVTVPRDALQNARPNANAHLAVPAPIVHSPIAKPIPEIAEKLLYAPVDHVTVSAHEVGTAAGVDHTWKTDYGSYDRDTYRSKALEVEVRNVSRRGTGDCQVMAYWMGRKLSDRSMLIHHAEMLPTNIGAAASATVRFWCPLLAANETNYAALGTREVSGAKIDGWFVLVSRNGHTIGGVASSPTYQTLLGSPAQLGPLLAGYKPSGKHATASLQNWRNDSVRTDWQNQKHAPTESRSVP